MGALTVAALFIVAMEVRLLARGFPATAVDSELSWFTQRNRASGLGEKALILIGASRMQCDIDIDALRERTKLEPVQLAIDGNPFIPVLDGLSADPNFRGTVIVSFTDEPVAGPENASAVASRPSVAETYEADFRRHRYSNALNFETSEALLTDAVHSRLRSYADGARPITSLMKRILVPSATQHYAVVLPDRSRLIDFRLVTMPDFYFARAVRALGQDVAIEPGMSYTEVEAAIQARIDALTPHANQAYLQRAASIAAMAAAIEARGGHVMFVVFPTGGFITAMDEKRFPRRQFWDRFVALTHSPTIHFADIPALRKFPVPDGSHLDYRARTAFTLALADELGLGVGTSVPPAVAVNAQAQ